MQLGLPQTTAVQAGCRIASCCRQACWPPTPPPALRPPRPAGGILLGPSRFQLINNTARQLLEACGYIAGKDGGGKGGSGGKGKKR